MATPGLFSFSLPALSAAQSVSWLSIGPSAPLPDPRARARQEATLGDSLYARGRFDQAILHHREAVRLQPNDPDYHCKLALSAWCNKEAELAESHLQTALRLAPQSAKVHELLSQWYDDEGQMERALHHSARAIELDSHSPEIAITRAWVLQNQGEPQAAWELLEPLLKSGFRSARLGMLFSRVASKFKREGQALEYIAGVLDTPEAPASAKIPLHFAAATLLDHIGRYDEAFEHARLGNEARRCPYEPARFTRWVDSQISYFTSNKLHDLPLASHQSRRPVFIVGMPRSGTSLVEQILASHPQVHGAGELKTLSRIAASALRTDWSQGEIYPYFLDALCIRKANELARTYLSNLTSLNSTATYVTDKMPQNFLYLGLIAVLFPNCHVIHCTRNPLDTCLSCYMTFFATGQEFSHDLAHVGAFYRDYHRLMTHFKRAVTYPLIEVNYENLVNDLEGQTRRLLESLGLPWDERCLRFHQTKRSVATASRDQVRRPIYASSIGRWKHYEKHLLPLMSVLDQSPAVRDPP